jgi:2-dehydro-3-deoxyphosphogluconate aldolase/(4S)-4-hydroxy-2-oxoglutarate aldolase
MSAGVGPAPQIAQQLAAIGIVPVVSLADAGRAEAVAHALMAGGIGCIEVTFRTPAAADAIARISGIEGLLVGAGTVLCTEQLHAAREAGARFALSPALNPEIVAAAAAAGMPFFPGVGSAGEIDQARRLGLSTVKIFPAAAVGGPGFLRSVAEVFPDVGFIPTGGIGPDNLALYARAPGVVAVGGSWLTRGPMVPEDIETLARDARAVLTRARERAGAP